MPLLQREDVGFRLFAQSGPTTSGPVPCTRACAPPVARRPEHLAKNENHVGHEVHGSLRTTTRQSPANAARFPPAKPAWPRSSQQAWSCLREGLRAATRKRTRAYASATALFDVLPPAISSRRSPLQSPPAHVILRGRPIRSASLNFTPGRSARRPPHVGARRLRRRGELPSSSRLPQAADQHKPRALEWRNIPRPYNGRPHRDSVR